MANSNQKDGNNRPSASFAIGAISLIFLTVGYQAAVFVHRASVMKMASDRSHPDTVFVIDDEMAARIFDEGFRDDGTGTYGWGRETSPYGRPNGTVSSGHVDGRRGKVVTGKVSHGEDGYGNPESGTIRSVQHSGRKYYVRKSGSETDLTIGKNLEKQIARARPELFRFNPNTVSVTDLMRLGFTEKQAQSIDNYRQSGGNFRRKSDFAKSYVVSEDVYDRLEPYIDIPLLDINIADSAAFEKLPGIGAYYSARMVSYRKELGGYSFKEQLMDIYRFDKAKFDALSDLIEVRKNTVRPYGLWTLPEDSLKKHPYIKSYSAHGIVLFRENTPSSEWSPEALVKAGIIKKDVEERFLKCVFDTTCSK